MVPCSWLPNCDWVGGRLPTFRGCLGFLLCFFFFFVGILLGFTANLLCNIPTAGNSIWAWVTWRANPVGIAVSYISMINIQSGLAVTLRPQYHIRQCTVPVLRLAELTLTPTPPQLFFRECYQEFTVFDIEYLLDGYRWALEGEREGGHRVAADIFRFYSPYSLQLSSRLQLVPSEGI